MRSTDCCVAAESLRSSGPGRIRRVDCQAVLRDRKRGLSLSEPARIHRVSDQHLPALKQAASPAASTTTEDPSPTRASLQITLPDCQHLLELSIGLTTGDDVLRALRLERLRQLTTRLSDHSPSPAPL